MKIDAIRQNVTFHFPEKLKATIKVYVTIPLITYVAPSGSKNTFVPLAPFLTEDTEYLIATFNKTEGSTDYYINDIWKDLYVNHLLPIEDEDYLNTNHDWRTSEYKSRIEIIYD
jgi:hypothetical protein